MLHHSWSEIKKEDIEEAIGTFTDLKKRNEYHCLVHHGIKYPARRLRKHVYEYKFKGEILTDKDMNGYGGKNAMRFFQKYGFYVIDEKALMEEQQFINDMKSVLLEGDISFEYDNTPKEKEYSKRKNGKQNAFIPKRDKQVAINALKHAGFKCEINKTHPTFLRRNQDVAYTEPHHLIPFEFYDEFDWSVDKEENIVSLCSNCHNQIHYGKDADLLIKKLYKQRVSYLKKIGLEISLKRLLEMYGYYEK